MIQGHSIIALEAKTGGITIRSKNHLMRRFARAGNKVIFVNSISMGLAPVANKDFLAAHQQKIAQLRKTRPDKPEGITVVSPAALPFFAAPEPGQSIGV